MEKLLNKQLPFALVFAMRLSCEARCCASASVVDIRSVQACAFLLSGMDVFIMCHRRWEHILYLWFLLFFNSLCYAMKCALSLHETPARCL